MNSSYPWNNDNGLFEHKHENTPNRHVHDALRQYLSYSSFYNFDTQGNGTRQYERWYHVSCSNLLEIIPMIE
jgi:hypothetical protein